MTTSMGVCGTPISVSTACSSRTSSSTDSWRFSGLRDMARAIAADRPHIATGELGYHVLDVMLSAQDAAASGETVRIASTVAPVPLLEDGFDPFARTL